jgi:hypothetical protein
MSKLFSPFLVTIALIAAGLLSVNTYWQGDLIKAQVLTGGTPLNKTADATTAADPEQTMAAICQNVYDGCATDCQGDSPDSLSHCLTECTANQQSCLDKGQVDQDNHPEDPLRPPQ